MKKLFIAIALLASVICVNAQSPIKRNGNTFSKEQVSKSEPIQTGYFWEIKGVKYPIWINPNSGACFIKRVSQKTGKEYKQYMPKEVSAQIAQEMGIEYKVQK